MGPTTSNRAAGSLTHAVNDSHRAAGCLVAALESAWEMARTRHPEIAPAVIVVASGTSGGAPRWGHFAACRWRRAADGGQLAEILIAGEGLDRGAVPVLGTLLHEAAHALAHARGIADTSRQGRYHNARYRYLAEELGLVVEQVPVIGWSRTAVPAATAEGYATEIEAIADSLLVYRRPEAGPSHIGAGGDHGTTGQRLRSGRCACPCGRQLRIGSETLAAGPVVCGLCRGEFAPGMEGQA